MPRANNKPSQTGNATSTRSRYANVTPNLVRRKPKPPPPFSECPMEDCGVVWPSWEHLNSHVHRLVQKDWTLLPCPWPGCDARIRQKCNLLRHFHGKHTDERPHECAFCEEDFNDQAGRNHHMERWHGYVPKKRSKNGTSGVEQGELAIVFCNPSSEEDAPVPDTTPSVPPPRPSAILKIVETIARLQRSIIEDPEYFHSTSAQHLKFCLYNAPLHGIAAQIESLFNTPFGQHLLERMPTIWDNTVISDLFWDLVVLRLLIPTPRNLLIAQGVGTAMLGDCAEAMFKSREVSGGNPITPERKQELWALSLELVESLENLVGIWNQQLTPLYNAAMSLPEYQQAIYPVGLAPPVPSPVTFPAPVTFPYTDFAAQCAPPAPVYDYQPLQGCIDTSIVFPEQTLATPQFSYDDFMASLAPSPSYSSPVSSPEYQTSSPSSSSLDYSTPNSSVESFDLAPTSWDSSNLFNIDDTAAFLAEFNIV